MITNNNFDNAKKLFDLHNFDKAFDMFEKVANNDSFTNEERAEAFNMMGVIVSGFAPYIAPEESNGVHFYKKALSLNPSCISALLNIISSFGVEDSSMHTEKDLFIRELQKKYQIYLNLI
jgi:hypothetical protein